MLSAATHGHDPDITKVLDVMADALTHIEPERAELYSEFLLGVLPNDPRSYLEVLMATGTYEYQSDYAQRLRAEGRVEGRAEGEAKGEANAVLLVLDARGITVPDDARDRITACTDLDRLGSWVRRATTADTIDELFA